MSFIYFFHENLWKFEKALSELQQNCVMITVIQKQTYENTQQDKPLPLLVTNNRKLCQKRDESQVFGWNWNKDVAHHGWKLNP